MQARPDLNEWDGQSPPKGLVINKGDKVYVPRRYHQEDLKLKEPRDCLTLDTSN